jgi:sugar phosphate isomerase/epimerase
MKLICSLSAFKTDHEAALARIRKLGFDQVDLILISNWGITDPVKLADNFDQETEKVQKILSKHDLKAVAVNAAFSPHLWDRENEEANEKRREQVRAVCRFMKALEIPIAAHYPGHIADWKNDTEGVFSGSVETLKEIQQISHKEGVVLAPEIHFNTPFEKPEDARRLIQKVPRIPITYEPSHFIIKGIAYQDTADLLDLAANIHLRTCEVGQIQAPPPASMDALDWMMARLKSRNYQGTISIEYLPGADFDVWSAIEVLRDRYL